jgi:UDP-N-acetyl-D-mannosaminuronic acid dehydrogenase
VKFAADVAVVGGCGRVGLPLCLALAERGLRVVAYDTDRARVAGVRSRAMPFAEPGANVLLNTLVDAERFMACTDPSVVSAAEHVVVVVGTPVDNYLDPRPEEVPGAIEMLADRLVDGQLLVLRSTVYPGVTRRVEELVSELRLDIDVSFCPERIAEGHALTELRQLPQIVSSRTPRGSERAAALFRHLTDDIVVVTPEEAELAKLFTNTWRYIKFAAANQLFMIANDCGVDFERVRQAITHNYPRASDMPGAGFAAGPCLFKDTMQLAAFDNNNFTLGHASMTVNEGLPRYLVSRMERQYDLKQSVVGILGMAFKSESDDIRSSLSYRLRRILRFKAKAVLCTDPYVTVDDDLVPLESVLENADILVIGAPHAVYRSLCVRLPVIDVWNALGRGVLT